MVTRIALRLLKIGMDRVCLHASSSGPSPSGGLGGLPVFGRSVNPISTRGDTLSPPRTTSHPGFSDLVTALLLLC